MSQTRRCDLCGETAPPASSAKSAFWSADGWAKVVMDYAIPEKPDMDLCPTCVAAIALVASHGYAWSLECVDHHGVRVAPGNVKRPQVDIQVGA